MTMKLVQELSGLTASKADRAPIVPVALPLDRFEAAPARVYSQIDSPTGHSVWDAFQRKTAALHHAGVVR